MLVSSNMIIFEIIRNKDAEEEHVDIDLKNLLKFIHTRSKSSKDILFITLSISNRGICSGYIIVKAKKTSNDTLLEKEADILETYVKTYLSNIQVIKRNIGKAKDYVPIPGNSFFKLLLQGRSLFFIDGYGLRQKVFYPIQSVEQIGNIVPLGNPIGLENIIVGIPIDYIPQHIAILGATGSGKTTTVIKLVKEIWKNYRKYVVVIIDWHGEYCEKLPIRCCIDPVEKPLLNSWVSIDNIDEAVDVIEESLNLTGPQSYILYTAIRSALKKSKEKKICLKNIVENIHGFIEEANWQRESKYSLLRKLGTIMRFLVCEDSSELHDLVSREGIIVFNVSKIRNVGLRKAYTLLLLKILLTLKQSSVINRDILMVVEEAHNVFPRDTINMFTRKYVAEVRKFGISLTIVTQSPSSIVEDVMKNTATKIVHSIRSSVDIDVISRIMKLPAKYEKLLPVLEPGEAIFYNPRYKYPVIIKVSIE